MAETVEELLQILKNAETIAVLAAGSTIDDDQAYRTLLWHIDSLLLSAIELVKSDAI